MATSTTTEAPTCKIDLPGGIGIRAYPYPYTEECAKSWFDIVSSEENMTRSGQWTAEGGATGPFVITNYAVTVNDEAVGAIGLDFGKDVYFRTAELGYWLGEEHWGKGVMSKAVPPFLQWAFDTFGILVRVNAEANADNQGSASVLKKSGFVFEGRRANAAFKHGKCIDTLMLGALRPT